MRNMLKRSLGAGSFREFWRYWNPIWGYYLSRYLYFPLQSRVSAQLALLLTFLASGFLHDVAIMLFTQQPSFKLSLWFLLMGAMVLLTDRLKFHYALHAWSIRALINFSLMALSYFLAHWMLKLISIFWEI